MVRGRSRSQNLTVIGRRQQGQNHKCICILNYEKYKNPFNLEQFFDDVISGHNDIIGC